jgi:orotidine 5'-phosphate decarboxylase subfamily 2
LCVGIDPHTDSLPPFFQSILKANPEQFLSGFSKALIDAAESIPAVKFQSSFFEVFGQEGWASLRHCISYAKQKGKIVILDAKRGDISSTMQAYGRMAFDTLAADILTVTPYMGSDVIRALEPWLSSGKGIYVVWVSSNQSGHEVQDLAAELVLKYTLNFLDEKDLHGAIGFVLGATKVDSLHQDLFDRIKRLPLLMPGVGAQGAQIGPRMKELLMANCGTLIPVSRGISGIGMSSQQAELSKIDSWTKFGDYAASRVKEVVVDLAH